MLFPTHLLVAALLGRQPRLPSVWIVAGAALPDLMDKPLAMVGVIEVYQSIGHSLLFGAIILPLALRGPAGRAVAVGWGSHLILDALHLVLNGRPGHVRFLGWPLTVPTDPLGLPPVAFAIQYLGTPSFVVEVILWLGAAGLAYRRLRHRGARSSDASSKL